MYMKDITFCINKECKERKDCFRAEENYQDTNSVNSYAMFDCNDKSNTQSFEGNIKNTKKERELILIDGMVNSILKQTEDLLVAIDGLNKYPNEDIRAVTEKMLAINKKLCKLKKVY